MKTGSVLLLLNGELRDERAARAAARSADAVICADGGARHAAAMGVIPDFVIGDLDSLPSRLPPSWKRTSVIKVPDQGSSDLVKALDLIRKMGATKVIVAGALGGGLDHELVNLAVLEKARGFELTLIGGGEARLLGPGRHRLALKKGRRFSLLAAPRARLSLTGARYGLSNEALARGSRGLGNRAEGPVTLTVKAGRAWFVLAGAAGVLAAAAVTAAARAGGGEGYSSGSSGSSFSGSSGYSYSGGSGGSGGGRGGGLIGDLISLYIMFVAQHPIFGIPLTIILVMIGLRIYYPTYETRNDASAKGRGQLSVRLAAVIARLRERDPAFEPKEFVRRCGAAFLKVQEAWSAGDLTGVRAFVSDGVIERFGGQLADLRSRGLRNVVSGVQVIDAEILYARSDARFDSLCVRIEARAVDFMAGPDGVVVSGTSALQTFEEVWTFLRRPGAKTLKRPGLLEGACPSCGAILSIMDAAQCAACQSWVNAGEHDWVLAEITQSCEWAARDGELDVDGWVEASASDPSLSLAAIEDRASVIFWRWMDARRRGDAAALGGAADPAFCAAFTAEAPVQHPAVGAVEAVAFEEDGDWTRVHVSVKWSGRTSEDNPETRRHFLVLKRARGAKTDPRQWLRTARCPSCGAAPVQRDAPACAYCSAALNDGRGGWVLTEILPFGEWKRPLREAPAKRVLAAAAKEPVSAAAAVAAKTAKPEAVWGRDLSSSDAFAALAMTALADGEESLAERAFLDSYGRARGVPAARAAEIMGAARKGLLDAPRPQNGQQAETLLRGMIRMSLADGSVDDRERAALNSFGVRFALTPAAVEEMVVEERAAIPGAA